MKRYLSSMVVVVATMLGVVQTSAIAQPALVVKLLVEKKVPELPSGPLLEIGEFP
jgi:hypothetical protein